MKKRVVVGMSGGIDSSVAACLLKEEGYEVIGINLKLFSQENNEGFAKYGSGCCGVQGIEDARNVAQKIGIPFYVLNCEKEFENKVINYFCEEYLNGRTPNPCIICNEKIKFGILLEISKSLNADYIATGHYARIEYDDLTKRYILKKGKDEEKDQSYFLFSISQDQLSHIIFRLGEYRKAEIRQLAQKFGLKIYNKPASQEICFITTNYHEFLKRRVGSDIKPGPLMDREGKILGQHQGIAFYTIGQRKMVGAHKKPFYVISIDRQKNTIIIGPEEKLYRDRLIAKDVNWISFEPKKFLGKVGGKVKARIRYKHQEAEAVVSELNAGSVEVKFNEPQRAITPGQAVVFYQGDMVIGGGWIWR